MTRRCRSAARERKADPAGSRCPTCKSRKYQCACNEAVDDVARRSLKPGVSYGKCVQRRTAGGSQLDRENVENQASSGVTFCADRALRIVDDCGFCRANQVFASVCRSPVEVQGSEERSLSPQMCFLWVFDDLDPGSWDSSPLLALRMRVTGCKKNPITGIGRDGLPPQGYHHRALGFHRDKIVKQPYQ
jgi:hypothetical protein